IDYVILAIYFVFVLGIGWALKRYMKTSTDFFLSGRSIPAWITGLAFISANLGAQEVIGMGASGAKYGIATSHFYWVGAIHCVVGVTLVIYDVVLQVFLIVLGFLPLVFLGLKDAGGWAGLQQRLAMTATAQGYAPGTWTESWRFMTTPAANPMGVEWFGMVMGLGFVLSFGYWCTDFLVVQRAMAANSMSAARRTPRIAALPNIVFTLFVILPATVPTAPIPH